MQPPMEPPGDYRKRAATQHGTILLEATRLAIEELARSFFFSEPVAWLETQEPYNLPGLFEQLEAARKAGLWTAGYFIMIADLLRSDLGRMAEMGSVRVTRLFAVERFPSLLQMSSEITATLRPDVAAYTLLGSLFPSGSIVGAPKVRTMQILRELEGRERGIYTGAVGFFAPGGEAVFSVATCTTVLHGNQVEMGVGAGIT